MNLATHDPYIVVIMYMTYFPWGPAWGFQSNALLKNCIETYCLICCDKVRVGIVIIFSDISSYTFIWLSKPYSSDNGKNKTIRNIYDSMCTSHWMITWPRSILGFIEFLELFLGLSASSICTCATLTKRGISIDFNIN